MYVWRIPVLSFEDRWKIVVWGECKKLLFNEISILLDGPKLPLSNSSREQSFYNSILLYLAGKKKGLTDISKLMNVEKTKINKYMKTLLVAK